MSDETPNPNPAPWFGADAAPEIKGFVENKGWDSPTKAIDAYRSLETFVGADKAGRGVVWPKDDADTAGWNGVYTRLGRPESADGYKFNLGEGANAAFVQAIAPEMHKLGLSSKQAEGLAAFVAGFEKQQAEAWEAERSSKVEQSVAAFKTKLGASFNPTVELGKRAAKTLGVNDEQFAGLEETLGLEGTVTLFAAIGKKLGEDQFVGGGDARPTGDLSPAAATQRIEQLKADQGWMAKLLSGDRAAIEEKDRLDANMLGMTFTDFRKAKAG